MRKEKILEVLQALPDEVDVDSLMEKLYLLRKIEVAEQQLADGQGISHEHAKKQLEPWLE